MGATMMWVTLVSKLANIWLYHLNTNGQHERFNQTLISVIGTLETNDKQCWKDYLPTLLHVYNCTKNNAMDFSQYLIFNIWTET